MVGGDWVLMVVVLASLPSYETGTARLSWCRGPMQFAALLTCPFRKDLATQLMTIPTNSTGGW
ncbi:hypothetical protein NC653_030192 [Populus alba x Populus x berolinensis]|nr:hypothetical protein NC653_030192 [Populus alba x Populus x berolinensis]